LELIHYFRLSFTGFFKNPYNLNPIFESQIAPTLKSNILVESWGRPYQPSDCNGKYQTLNILKISLEKNDLGKN
jgi:hypothetical protein